MKWFGIRRWVIVVLAVCAPIGLVAWQGTQIKTGTTTVYASAGGVTASSSDVPKLLPFTSNLPRVDRVEVEAIESDFNGDVTRVLATNILIGSRAEDFGDLWRSQHYLLGQVAMCHQPGYRIRFSTEGSLLIETTVCFNCEDIFFRKPGFGPYGASFNSKTDAGKKLRAYLADLFPGHDPDANKP